VSILKLYPSPTIAILPKESDFMDAGMEGRVLKKFLFSYLMLMLEFRGGNRAYWVGLIF
jgi:hypothetical protein